MGQRERIREAIESVEIPRTDGNGPLRVTASVDVAASTDGDHRALIAATDAALYEAKHQGKNRTVRAAARPANVASAE